MNDILTSIWKSSAAVVISFQDAVMRFWPVFSPRWCDFGPDIIMMLPCVWGVCVSASWYATLIWSGSSAKMASFYCCVRWRYNRSIFFCSLKSFLSLICWEINFKTNLLSFLCIGYNKNYSVNTGGMHPQRKVTQWLTNNKLLTTLSYLRKCY